MIQTRDEAVTEAAAHLVLSDVSFADEMIGIELAKKVAKCPAIHAYE